MASFSSFPGQIDSFQFKTEILASDVPAIQRFQELKLKSNRTPSEETELGNLTTQLRSKLMAADEWNKFQDALVNMEVFIRDNVEGYITDKQKEIDNSKDSALIAIEQKKQNIIDYMDGTTAGQIRNDIGVMGDLATINKTSLVNAVNEVNSKVNNISIPDASTTQKGVVQLNNTTTSTSITQAPTANALKSVNDKVDTHVADNSKHVPHLGTTTNVGDVYSISTNEAINSNQKFTIKFNAASSTTPTLKINGGTAYGIKKPNGNYAKLYASVYSIFWDGTAFILQGEGGEYGTAVAGDVRAGKTIGTDTGLIIGTLPERSTTNIVPSGSVQNFPSGIYNAFAVAAGKQFASGTTSSIPALGTRSIPLLFTPKQGMVTFDMSGLGSNNGYKMTFPNGTTFPSGAITDYGYVGVGFNNSSLFLSNNRNDKVADNVSYFAYE